MLTVVARATSWNEQSLKVILFAPAATVTMLVATPSVAKGLTVSPSRTVPAAPAPRAIAGVPVAPAIITAPVDPGVFLIVISTARAVRLTYSAYVPGDTFIMSPDAAASTTPAPIEVAAVASVKPVVLSPVAST